MSLSEKLLSIAPLEPGLPCGVSKVLRAVEEQDRDTLEKILAKPSVDGGVSSRQIHELLISEGHNIAYSSIGLHRRKQCRCFTGKVGKLRIAKEI